MQYQYKVVQQLKPDTEMLEGDLNAAAAQGYRVIAFNKGIAIMERGLTEAGEGEKEDAETHIVYEYIGKGMSYRHLLEGGTLSCGYKGQEIRPDLHPYTTRTSDCPNCFPK